MQSLGSSVFLATTTTADSAAFAENAVAPQYSLSN